MPGLTRILGRAVWLLGALAGCSSPSATSRAGASNTWGPSAAGGTQAKPPNNSVRELRAPFGPRGAEICFNATDDNGNGLLDEGCGVEQGDVQFLIAWTEGDLDVDLHVTGPSGETATLGTRTRDGLTKLRDCPGEGQECQERNQEEVVLDGSESNAGRYVVRVRLEDLGSRTPPVQVRLGARLGARTSGYLLDFWRPGSEAIVSLEYTRDTTSAK